MQTRLLQIAQLIASYEATGIGGFISRAEKLSRNLEAEAPRHLQARAVAMRGTVLWTRFEHARKPADLQEAIACFERSVILADFDVDAWASALAELAALARLRWETHGEAEDIENGLECIGKALDVTERSDQNYPGREVKKASLLEARYLVFGDRSDLHAAAQCYEHALSASDAPSASLFGLTASSYDVAMAAGMHSNLALVLVTGQAAIPRGQLDTALQHAETAVAGVPERHRLHARFLSNLSQVRLRRYEQTSDLDELRAAYLASEAAVAATRPGDAAAPIRHLCLARILDARLRHDPHPLYLDRQVWLTRRIRRLPRNSESVIAQAALLEAKALRVGSEFASGRQFAAAERRLGKFARRWRLPADLQTAVLEEWAHLALRRSPREALPRFEQAVERLAMLRPRRAVSLDEIQLLADFRGLAGNAAACAVMAGHPDRAAALLERGRGVVLTRQLGVNRPLLRLKRDHPDRAAAFEKIRDQLNTRRPNGPNEREQLARAFGAIISEVRALGGYEDFFDLDFEPQQFADRVPLVWVNVARLGSHAIIADNGFEVVELQGVDERTVKSAVVNLQRAATGGPEQARETEAVLEWTWTHITAPILSRLGIDGPPTDGRYPTVCWIPTGLATQLPLHAAGKGDEAVIDRVVSTYAPTAMSRRERGTVRPDRRVRAVAVAVASHSGLARLRAAGKEAAIVAGHVPGTRILKDEAATAAAVSEALNNADLAHFSCHAAAPDRADPGSGGLMLHGSERLAPGDVPVSETAALAFLSACRTSQPAIEMVDESLHIAGAFKLAGYRSVIGTLWPVRDRQAVAVADAFYGHFDPAQPQTSAEALHLALREIRSRTPKDPRTWAGYIHFG
ncbi:CHAT domain-containing protein [Glycomyces luteolus]|uniref:CHAT domain-containing protein n=1 Tax=Glycomyces luteolus TaxID=2670330 RepID=A0A9X3T209_9ACTN|nr:CHAT domain-containing protein [Glycomyces luteolus]MDA1358225.1 CHAT domain-containing protein [Glycomyces luteolus]